MFYSVTYDEKPPLTPRRAQYILQKYGEQARCICQEVPEKVHPHLFRHSRAMHPYQKGIDLALVSQWLGHSQLETTQIYAHADTEHKRIAIANSISPDNPLYSKLDSARYTISDEQTNRRRGKRREKQGKCPIICQNSDKKCRKSGLLWHTPRKKRISKPQAAQ